MKLKPAQENAEDLRREAEMEFPIGGSLVADPPQSESPLQTQLKSEEVPPATAAAKVPKQKVKYKLLIINLARSEVIHEARFVAAGNKGLAQYLRRIGANLSMQEE